MEIHNDACSQDTPSLSLSFCFLFHLKEDYLRELEHLGMMWGSKRNLERHGIHYSATRVSGHVCTMLGETLKDCKAPISNISYILSPSHLYTLE